MLLRMGEASRVAPVHYCTGAPSEPDSCVSTQRAASPLGFEPGEEEHVERSVGLSAATVGPVLGAGGVVGGRPPRDHRVSDDLGPGELGQVGATVVIAEDPPVVAGGVEPVEVAVHPPPPGLVGM